MSNLFSLDDLRDALDKEFAPLQLELDGETLTLRNLMRIPGNNRDEVLAALDVIQENKGEDGEDEDQSAEDVKAMATAVEVVLRNVTGDGKGEKLVRTVNGDLLLGMKILELWTEATQPGEAENSPN
jgi:hypothetical protein